MLAWRTFTEREFFPINGFVSSVFAPNIRCTQSPLERAGFLKPATAIHIKHQCKEYGCLTLPFIKFCENLLGNEGLIQPSIKQTALGNRISHGKVL